MSSVLRQTLRADANHTIHVVLPQDMGDQVEVIVFPVSSPADQILNPDEAFMVAAYSAVTENDPEEDAIWGKYVRS